MKLVFHPDYDIRLQAGECAHPFDGAKYGKTWALIQDIVGSNAAARALITPVGEISREQLMRVHSAAYLDSLAAPSTIASIIEVREAAALPFEMLDNGLLRPMRLATRGTMDAAQAALEFGCAANLSGGYHHAKPDSGEGFCVYADLAVAIADLRARGLLGADARILHVDTDAHRGNGVADCFMDDPRMGILDVFNEHTYPLGDEAARARVDWAVPLAPGTTGATYAKRLGAVLEQALDANPWSMVVHNAGTDVWEGDWVGGLALNARDVFERDMAVATAVRQRGIPLLHLPSGGYTDTSHRIMAYSMIALLGQTVPLSGHR